MPPKRKKGVKSGRIMRKRQTKTKKKVKLEVVDYPNDDDNTVQLCSICQDPCDVTNSEGALSCTKCKRLIALSTVKSSSPIKCKQCTKVFKFKTSYLKHLKNEHSKTLGSVSCDQCHVSCPNKMVLEEHIKTSHNRKEFECPQCLKKFVRHAHVLRHMAQCGCDGTEISMFPCEICDAKFTRKDNLIAHLRYQHILSSAYACKHCKYRSKNFSKLIKHWQEVHLFPPKFECDICSKTTSSRTSMAKHLEIHGEKKYFCDTCGYSTFTAEVLKRHTLTHVEHKPHKCDICGASFIQRIQLQRHLERHAGNVCPTCGKTFNSKSKLIIHERTHLGLNRLLCPFDDCVFSKKEFSNEATLDTHVAGHLTAKKYHCEVCNKGYHAEVNMRRHMITHRLDRPRRCMYCVSARAYIRGEQLVRHVRNHHADIFLSHLAHVRRVLGTSPYVDRVKKSEMESILTMLDAESERILDGYGGTDVLYGGVTACDPLAGQPHKSEGSPLMSEDELVENLKKLLSQLIDKDTLECFGWPEETVDTVLEKVITHVGGRAADRARWTRVQCLRENTKQLFLLAVEDKHIARMLDTHTIDQVVKHILAQVTE